MHVTITDTLIKNLWVMQSGHFQLGYAWPFTDEDTGARRWQVTITTYDSRFHGYRPIAQFKRPTFLQAMRAIHNRDLK